MTAPKPRVWVTEDGSRAYILMGGIEYGIPVSEAVDLGREILAATEPPGTAPKMDRRRMAHMRTITAKPAPGEASAWCLNVHADHVRELLADRDHHASEAGRRKEQSKELADTCDEVDALTVELERLRPLADALGLARELVDGLARRGASCAELSEGYREGTVEWARCGGKATAFEQAAGMLADIVSPRASEGPTLRASAFDVEQHRRQTTIVQGSPLEPMSEGAATPTQDELDGAAGRQQDDQYAALGKRGER